MIPAFLLAAAVASAPQALPVLTLDEALSQASRDNLDLKSARARLDQAATGVQKAKSARLPQISLSGGYTYNNLEAVISLPTGYYLRDLGDAGVGLNGPAFDPSQPLSPTNPPGVPSSMTMIPSGFNEATIQKHNQLGGQLSVNQVVWAPALEAAIDLAQAGEQTAAAGIEAGRRELLFAVAQLYYGAVAAREASRVQDQLVAANVEHENDARKRVDAGVMPKVALLRAQIDRSKAEGDRLKALNGYASARSALAALLNREPDFDVDMPPEPPGLDDPSKLEQGLGDRPDIRAAEAGLRLAEKGERAVQQSFLPSVGLQGAYRAANISGFVGQATSWFITLGINWTVWDGGLRDAQRAEARGRMAEADAAVQGARVKARDELRRALLDLESAQANRTRADELVTLAREGRQLVELGFKAGTATYVEVSDANVALAGAEMAQVAERLNAQLALLKVARAGGRFDPK